MLEYELLSEQVLLMAFDYSRWYAIARQIVLTAGQPKVAFCAVTTFSVIWLVIGSLTQVFLEQVLHATSFLSWYADAIGHFLTVLTLTVSGTVWWESSIIEDRLRRVGNVVAKSDNMIMRVAPFAFGLICCLILTNVLTVCIFDDTVRWSHRAIPYLLPFLIACAYYVIGVFPLLLSLGRYGGLLYYSAQRCHHLPGYTLLDERKMCGLGWFGRSRVFSLALITLACVVPLLLQRLIGFVSPGSYIVGVLGIAIVVGLVFVPLLTVTIHLARLRGNRLKRLDNVISQCRSELGKHKSGTARRDSAEREITSQEGERKLVQSQRTLPIPTLARFFGAGWIGSVSSFITYVISNPEKAKIWLEWLTGKTPLLFVAVGCAAALSTGELPN